MFLPSLKTGQSSTQSTFTKNVSRPEFSSGNQSKLLYSTGPVTQVVNHVLT